MEDTISIIVTTSDILSQDEMERRIDEYQDKQKTIELQQDGQ